MLVGLIIFGLVANLGGVDGVYTRGRYWRDQPFNDAYKMLRPVSLARFLGFWKVLTQAAFAFGGIEGVNVLAGETYNPRKTMKSAVKTVVYRIGTSFGNRILSAAKGRSWAVCAYIVVHLSQCQPAFTQAFGCSIQGRFNGCFVPVRSHLSTDRRQCAAQ